MSGSLEERSFSASPGVVRAALEQILAHPAFASSPRLTGFLRFIVEETLAGREAKLKAYTIATGVFGLPDSFDPQSNSIVRVEAMRLRKALERYYAESGAGDDLIIRLAPGSYVPHFERRAESTAETADVAAARFDQVIPLPDVAPPNRQKLYLAGALAASVAVAALLGGVALQLVGRAVVAARPSVATPIAGQASIRVEISQGEGTSDFAKGLSLNLESALAHFSNPVVRTGSSSFLAELGPFDYLLSGRIEPALDGWTASFLILRARSGEVLWTRTYDKLKAEELSAVRSRIVVGIASRIARSCGVLQVDVREQLSRQGIPHEGYGCIYQSDSFFAAPHLDSFKVVEACLLETIRNHPSFGDAHSAYARVLVDGWFTGTGEISATTVARAARHADESIALRPHDARSHLARFFVRFADHRFEDAFDEGRLAMDLNPFGPDIAANVGGALVLRGQFEEGLKLLRHSSQFSESLPGWYDVFFFLEAYMRNDWDEASKQARRRSLSRFPLGIMAKMLVAAKIGDAVQTQKLSAEMRESFPAFSADLAGALERRGMVDTMRKRILTDLGASN